MNLFLNVCDLIVGLQQGSLSDYGKGRWDTLLFMCPLHFTLTSSLALPLGDSRLGPSLAWCSRRSWWDSGSWDIPVQGSGIMGKYTVSSQLELPSFIFPFATNILGVGGGIRGQRDGSVGKSAWCMNRTEFGPQHLHKKLGVAVLPQHCGEQRQGYLWSFLAARMGPGSVKNNVLKE